MSRTVTTLVELAIGLGCLAGGFGARRQRWLAALLTVAGLAAVAHAVTALV